MDNYGYLLSDCSRLLRRDFDENVRSLGLTGPQARLLLLLSRQEGASQSHYADLLDVEAITLCRMVDRMEESELVIRRPAQEDRRVRALFLTERSRAIVQEVRSRVDRMLADIANVLDDGEREALQATLDKVRHHLRERRSQGTVANG